MEKSHGPILASDFDNARRSFHDAECYIAPDRMSVALRHLVFRLCQLGGVDESLAQSVFGLISRIFLFQFNPSRRQLIARFQRLLRCGIEKESDNRSSVFANLSRAWRSSENVTAEKQHSRNARAARNKYFVPFFGFNFHI